MKSREIIVLTDVALITCITQRGMADAIAKAAQEAGAQGATIHYAKGMGIRERMGVLGVAVNVEKEVINVVVSTEQVNRVFRHMYLAGNLDTPGMGIIFITKLEKAATYVPPEILDKLEAGVASAPP